MAHYLIEFRLRGFAKRYSQKLIKEIGKKVRVKGMKDKVSHITLYGPFTTNNEREMVAKVLDLCRKYNRIYFSIKGINYFNNPSNKVVYLDINPSEELKLFREKLSLKLKAITFTTSKEDTKNKADFKFHSTIAFKDINLKMNQILSYLKNIKHPNIRQTLLRVTILKNGKILNEYDFLQKRLFNRKQSLNKKLWKRTISLLKSKTYPSTTIIQSRSVNLWNKIKSFFTKHDYY
ncbi:2'-5' RNA ligase family protein [Candidatus Woesearchaeota archaeon]|nr:2'-5' RNA ligase family protein [Candidatus Woesearchaeota archaeon]